MRELNNVELAAVIGAAKLEIFPCLWEPPIIICPPPPRFEDELVF